MPYLINSLIHLDTLDEQPPSTKRRGQEEKKEKKVYGINKVFEQYNKQLLKDETWGMQVGAGRPKTADITSPKMTSDKKEESR